MLITDDLDMGALSGSPAERAGAALNAGCDLALYCPGELTATAALADGVTDRADRVIAAIREEIAQ